MRVTRELLLSSFIRQFYTLRAIVMFADITRLLSLSLFLSVKPPILFRPIASLAFVSDKMYERRCNIVWLLSTFRENIVACSIYIYICVKYTGKCWRGEGGGKTKGGRARRLENTVARDSKSWRIDRRRSVTRYSCQQAAGIAVPLSHLPFPSPVFYTVCYTPLPPSIPDQSPRRARMQEYSPCKCSIDVFSATEASRRPRSRFLRIAPFPSQRLQRFISRSWNTAAVTPPALIGDNCSIFPVRRVSVHRP